MEKTGIIYRKQFAREIFGIELDSRCAYPREKLISEPIFPYFVLDGGAFHFAHDNFGTVDSDKLLPKIMDGSLMEIFRVKNGGEYNWERSFEYTGDTGFRKKYEWQIWPQRLYMTIPIAHAYLRTGDRIYADRWLEIVRGWSAAHPYQRFDPSVHYITTDMVWRDMQVAWRTLSILHGLFMLQDAPFSESDWKWLYDFVKLHADHLVSESKDAISKNYSQNHVLQKGVALIMAGVMFPELGEAEDYLKYGSETVEMNMNGAIYHDGGSNEDSPSYSHFIARLYLEAYLLLKNNNKPMINGLERSVARQYEWLWHFMAPNGRALRISDSYAMDAKADLRRVSELFPLEFDKTEADRLFPDSRAAVMRRGDITLFADSMEYLKGHQHAGRPQLLLYYREDPILVDAGCCSYDRWEFYLPLMTASYHNVVYSPETDSRDNAIDPRIVSFDPAGGTIELSCVSESAKGSYRWTRRLELTAESIRITDHAEADEGLTLRSRLFIGRHDMDSSDKKSVRFLSDDVLITVDSALPVETLLMPVMNDDNGIDYSSVLQCQMTGGSFDNVTVFRFERR